jgi:tetratricopeptide (TPR) repeat protein
MGHPENAYERYQSAMAEWRAIGDPRFTAFGLNFLSSSALRLGRYAEARAALEESVALNNLVGDRWGLGIALRGLGLIAQAQGEHPQALEAFRSSLDTFNELGARWDVARALAEMARSMFALGDDAEAERLWNESLRMSIDAQATLCGLEAMIGIAGLQAKRGKIEAGLELLLVVLDHPASAQETRNRASQLQSELIVHLTPEEIGAVQMRAEAKTLASITEDILYNSRIS